MSTSTFLPPPSTNGHAPLPASLLSEISDLISTSKDKSSPLSLRSGERAGDRGLHSQTGPRTLAGKTFSRANAVKHADNATDDVFLASLTPDESAGFRKIRRALRRFYDPANTYERLVVDQMSIQHLRMLRLYRLESVAMTFLPINKGSDRSVFPHLDRFSRYDVRIERQLRILHNRLIELRLMRENNVRNPFPTQE